MNNKSRSSQLILFVAISYAYLWRLFGIGRLFGIPFSYDRDVSWALWHLPLFLMPGSFQYGHSVILFIYLLTGWTLAMAVFVGRSRGSVIPAILFHVSVNFIAFAIQFPYRYVYLSWGIVATISAGLLSRSQLRGAAR